MQKKFYLLYLPSEKIKLELFLPDRRINLKGTHMAKKLKPLPKFKNEDEEREFWDTHSSIDYIDWSKAKIGIFPNLKPTSSRPISIRLPDHLIDSVKVQANKLNIPYQSLMKQYIAAGVVKETPRKKYK